MTITIKRAKSMKLTNSDLKYHFHPQKGWLNDPNGLSFFKGQYHLFYQHLPNSEYPNGDPIHWGHAVTKDFLSYKELETAINPDMPYDAGGVWSGTAIEKDGVLYAFYASIDKNMKQTISVAYSKDGINFEKYADNPVISDYPADGSADFRDPAILYDNGKYYLVIASADIKKGTGNLLLYSSDDLFNWDYSGVLKEYADCKYCECPSFVKCDKGYLLSVSVCPKNSGHYFEVMYGDFDGKNFLEKITSHFQKGPDEYAGQIFHAPDGRNILISWIPGWEYTPKEKCIGCLSLPLEISVLNEKITAYPIKEVQSLIDKNERVVDAYIKEEFFNHGEAVSIKIDKFYKYRSLFKKKNSV